ncbi:unnamed protein product [Rangifer tarandus platyrhynchus]|uniref:Uncharacterized protein n=1 Tax=Rangifer tarandus platyrhynchus TaxID=3082113 RepID=A0ABN8XQ88_RANTA|nr:unnamed protein product [Rangifer tarandus platyrhynchus]
MKFRESNLCKVTKLTWETNPDGLTPQFALNITLFYLPDGWNKSGTWKMLPCKKRTILTESPQHQGSQEEDDLDLQSAVKPESDQVKDLGSVSLSWSPSHGRAADLDVQDAGIQLGMEDPSLSSRMLTDNTNVAVLEAVDVAVSQEITLPSLESSQPVNTHIGKGKLQATSSRRGKKITLRPGSVTQEDRGDHPIAKEPFSEKPSEEVKEEGEKDMNELMEESFETFQDEMGFYNMEDDGPEEEERVAEPRPNFNTPQALRKSWEPLLKAPLPSIISSTPSFRPCSNPVT